MKTPADRFRHVLLTTVALILAVLVGAGPALADPSAEEEAARAAGNTAAAEFVCGVLPIPEGAVKDKCVGLAEDVAAKAPTFEDIQPQLMCTALVPLGPAVTLGCVGLVSANVGGLRDAAQKAYDSTIGQVGEVVDTAKKAKKFIDDPQSALEELANTLKEGAVDFLNKVMGELVNMGNADFTAEWWRTAYAGAGGIGLLVAAIMMMLVLKDASRDRISASQFGESVQYLVGGIISIVWAPVIAYVVQNTIAAFNRGIIAWGGEDLYMTILDGAIYSIAAPTMPGGMIMGLIFWALLLFGAFVVFLMFIAQGLAVYMTALGMGIAFGMLAHPRWRAKALRVPMLVLGIMLSKPMLLFVITALFMMIQAFDPLELVGDDALQTLGEGCMIVLALFTVGLAPWVAFRFVPLLPDGSEVDAGGPNPGAAMSGAAGGMMMTMGMRRMNSGGGGGGGGGGGAAPATTKNKLGNLSVSGGQGTPGGASGAGAPAAGGKAMTGAAGVGKAGAAGGAASGAGTVVGGAASGGTLLLAAAAAKGAGSAAMTARSAAEGAAPQMQGSTGEEQQSSVHDRRN